MKRITSPGSMHDTGCSGLVHWDDPEAWYGEGGGRGVHVRELMHSHLPPHIISLDHPRAPAPSILYPASNIDWRFVSYMIVYMFQCHSPTSSHPRLLPQSPKVCSLYLSLLLSCIQGHHYHLSKFHIYVLVYCIGVFLSGLLHSV